MTVKQEKHKRKIKERGITLIALVITIIVLLILTGVALAALTGDSGILNNAETAKENTNLANAKEQIELAAQGARLENVSETGKMTITYDNLKNELDNVVGNGKYEIDPKEEADSWTVTVGEYEAIVLKDGSVIKALPRASGTKPWLPNGFSQVEGTDLSNGLTITNSTGLQNYVWIEVPTTIEEKITIEVDGVEKTKTVKLSNAANETEIAAVLEAYIGVYAKGASNQDNSSWKDEWYDSTGKNKDTEGANLEDTAGCGMTCSEYETAYRDMLNSIKKYGGFWLAQYEAGIAPEIDGETVTTNRKGHSEINITKANYTKDQYPYNWVYCSEAQKIANADSTNSYTSSLPFGIQWDLVCKFLDVKTDLTYNDIAKNSKWGNYINIYWTSSYTSKYSENFGKSFTPGREEKSSERYIHLTTGAIEKTTSSSDASPMNIYDLAGNVWEWTLEHATSSAASPCVCRGASCDYLSSNAAAVSTSCSPTNAGYGNTGFRSVLY